jgi:D-alanyl-lipoteichoic acid acyltransferase DltB (MBOAT superfamily)
MLFYTPQFIFGFLPLCFAAWILAARFWGLRAAMAALALASVVFYSVWNPWNLPVLLLSIAVNWKLAKWIDRAPSRLKLIVGLGFNLGLIGFFKYAGFIVGNLHDLGLASGLRPPDVSLPLGISFFSFQKIAYLVDIHQRKVRPTSLLDYALFVTFFPQLIAGPIVHHAEMMPQFRRLKTVLSARNFAAGLTIFSIGMFKKVVIADYAAAFARPVFDGAAGGVAPDFWSAWGAALDYTVQIYYDFSGYSDMALGLALLFGIHLPINFFSPYKSLNIIEFWRRWHITLSRFLRDYLYIPLGGGRKGPVRRYLNLMATMLLGGLWHGANWTFVLWGALHGGFLAVNHGYRGLVKRMGWEKAADRPGFRPLYWALTFLAVVFAWVLFRAEDAGTAWRIISAMIPGKAFLEAGTHQHILAAAEYAGPEHWVVLALILTATLRLPNSAQIMREHLGASMVGVPPDTRRSGILRLSWGPGAAWAFLAAGLFFMGLVFQYARGSPPEFIYFNF